MRLLPLSAALLLTTAMQPSPAGAQARVPRPAPVRRDPVVAPTAAPIRSDPAPDSAGYDIKKNVKTTRAPVAEVTPATIPARHARYRVTLTGMVVNHQTWDNPLQLDGKGDEVFIVAPVVLYDAQDKQLRQDVRQTLVLGDVNGHADYLQAGRASAQGGLVSGNRVPDVPAPWTRTADPTADRLPLLLFEGELEQGRHALIVSAAPWERDGGIRFIANLNVEREQRLRDWVARIDPTPLLSNASVRPVELPTPITMSLDLALGTTRDRPVGMRQASAPSVTLGGMFGGLAGPFAGPGLQSADMRFYEQLVVLTPLAIEQAITNPTKAGARLPGIVELRFVDAPRLQGAYTLYLQLERLP